MIYGTDIEFKDNNVYTFYAYVSISINRSYSIDDNIGMWILTNFKISFDYCFLSLIRLSSKTFFK